MRLLLISNSISYGKGYLDHCADEINDFLGSATRVLFIPFALKNYDEYEERAKRRFKKMNIILESIHHKKNYKQALDQSDAVFVGGGNTFRLLKALYDYDLIEFIRSRVKGRTLYIGASAGANIACPTIQTTNDMPIVSPPSLKALRLISFQINPHYLDAEPNSKHQGETREERIRQFHEENEVPVVGLREGAWLRIEDNEIRLGGKGGMKLFMKNKKPREYTSTSFPQTASSYLLDLKTYKTIPDFL